MLALGMALEQRLRARARERWPQIASLQIRHRGTFSYVDATLTGATTLKLCRLHYVGSAHDWQFAIYRASHNDYDESVFFTGLPVGTCQDTLLYSTAVHNLGVAGTTAP